MGEKYKYCTKCGKKNFSTYKFCKYCGHPFDVNDTNDYSLENLNKESTLKKYKKHIIVGLLVILILIISSSAVVVAGGFENIPYIFTSSGIQVNSVAQFDYKNFTNEYEGSAKICTIQFTTTKELNDTDILVYAYDSNNKLLDVVGNYYGTNETNIILSGDNPKNTVKTVNVTFAKKGYGDFNIKYLKFFVYKNENGNKKLVDKFIYKT